MAGAATLAAVALAAAGWWAGRHTFASAITPPDEVTSVVYEVTDARVGRSLSLNVTLEQPFLPVAANGLAGTVTWVGPVENVDVGDVLYAIDTIPVRAVPGSLPFWRPLSPGADGEDVRQLQRALETLGYDVGEVDGVFRWTTAEAVRQWEAKLGLSPDGVIELGELVAVRQLPARLRLAPEIVPGARLAGGEQVVFAANGEVTFSLVVSTAQARLIPPDATVYVEHGGNTWVAVLGESITDENGNVRFSLTGRDGGTVCGDECGTLPAAERTSLGADVTVVPEVSGPAVPVAALRTEPDGSGWVLMADGTRRDISVLGSSGGLAVVDGLVAGEQVMLFDSDRSSPLQPPSSPDAAAGGR